MPVSHEMTKKLIAAGWNPDKVRAGFDICLEELLEELPHDTRIIKIIPHGDSPKTHYACEIGVPRHNGFRVFIPETAGSTPPRPIAKQI